MIMRCGGRGETLLKKGFPPFPRTPRPLFLKLLFREEFFFIGGGALEGKEEEGFFRFLS